VLHLLFGSPSGTKSACPLQQSLPKRLVCKRDEEEKFSMNPAQSDAHADPACVAPEPQQLLVGSPRPAVDGVGRSSRRSLRTSRSRTRTCSTPVGCSSRTDCQTPLFGNLILQKERSKDDKSLIKMVTISVSDK
jgi:hypothetical protein